MLLIWSNNHDRDGGVTGSGGGERGQEGRRGRRAALGQHHVHVGAVRIDAAPALTDQAVVAPAGLRCPLAARGPGSHDELAAPASSGSRITTERPPSPRRRRCNASSTSSSSIRSETTSPSSSRPERTSSIRPRAAALGG